MVPMGLAFVITAQVPAGARPGSRAVTHPVAREFVDLALPKGAVGVPHTLLASLFRMPCRRPPLGHLLLVGLPVVGGLLTRAFSLSQVGLVAVGMSTDLHQHRVELVPVCGHRVSWDKPWLASSTPWTAT